MGEKIIYHVVPSNAGGWDITREGGSTPADHEDNRDEAIDKGKMLAKMEILGELVVHDQKGDVEKHYTFSDNLHNAPE